MNGTRQRIDHEDLLDRAQRYQSALPRPYLRWAGSKRALLCHVVNLLPRHFRTYWEPFAGSAALFFLLEPDRAILSDLCPELMATHNAVRDDVGAIVRYVKPMRPDPAFFYSLRAKQSRGRIKRAAEFIYLNKVCWNGLYRVNSKGQFNVPYGRPKTDNIADFENLRACARALAQPGVALKCCDFEKGLVGVRAGDLIYLDPPYVTRHDDNGFIDYNERLFSWKDQERLAKMARTLASRGAHVIVSNANHHDLINLYRGFERRVIRRSSTIASESSFRGSVREVLMYSVSRPHNGSK